MPRKRIIDPEFWSDEEIGCFWSDKAKLFYIGLWNFSDDEGRFKAHSDLLKSQIFPYSQKVNIDLLKKEICIKVQWYNINSVQYGYLRNFNKHQRIDKPQPSKLPNPPIENEPLLGIPGTFQDYSKNDPGSIPPNTTKDKISKDKGGGSGKEEKIQYLTYVWLEPSQYDKLVTRFGEDDTKQKVFALNNYIGAKGDKYKSHYHTILMWADRDFKHDA